MSAVGKIIKAPFNAVGAAAKALFSTPKAPVAQPAATRDDAAIAAARDDEVRRRRGGMANQLLGLSGAEAGVTAAKQLTGQ